MAADRRADVRAPHFAAAGSQKWLQVAIERRPKTLLSAFRRCGAVERASSVEWRSPLREKEFKAYRDHAALTLAGAQPLRRPLDDFWPARGPVWDAIGVRSRGGARRRHTFRRLHHRPPERPLRQPPSFHAAWQRRDAGTPHGLRPRGIGFSISTPTVWLIISSYGV